MKVLENLLVINLLISFPLLYEGTTYWLECGDKYIILDFDYIQGKPGNEYQICT